MVTGVTGTLIQSYLNCRRQTWLAAHSVTADQDNPFLEMGRLINEESYERETKSLQFENIKIDLIKKEGKSILVGEIKKSSKSCQSAKMQLLFYLYVLKEQGVSAKGVLLFPKERKRELIKLTEETKTEVKETIEEISRLVEQLQPPSFKKISRCKNCAYKEFCFA